MLLHEVRLPLAVDRFFLLRGSGFRVVQKGPSHNGSYAELDGGTHTRTHVLLTYSHHLSMSDSILSNGQLVTDMACLRLSVGQRLGNATWVLASSGRGRWAPSYQKGK